MKRWLLIIFALISMVGCANQGLSNLILTPEVNSVRLSHFSVEENSAVFVVDLYNPNPFPLPISGFSGDISLNELAIGSVAAKSEKTLSALSTQSLNVPLSLDPNSLINAAQSVLLRGEAQYQFDGHVDSSIGQVPFSKQGQLSAQDIMSALMPKLL